MEQSSRAPTLGYKGDRQTVRHRSHRYYRQRVAASRSTNEGAGQKDLAVSMDTPIPTPFDIIDPNPGALVPTSLTWILLLVIALLGALITLLRSRKPGPAKIHRTLQRLLVEIRQAADTYSRPSDLDRIIRLAKRIISPYLDADAASLTATELRQVSHSFKTKHDESKDVIAAGLAALADLEDLAYAPNDTAPQSIRAKELVVALISRLESLVKGVRPL